MPQRMSPGLIGIFVLLQLTLVSLFIATSQPDTWIVYIRRNKIRTPIVKEFSWDTLPPRQDLQWIDCFPNRQCARLIVPLNHLDLTLNKDAVIALIRRPSQFPVNSPQYGGPVLFNPGGPGGSGVDLIQGPRGDQYSIVVGPQFDVVGFDPRGVGRSTPRASFFATAVEREIWGEGSSVANGSAEGVARTWARARVLGRLAAMNDDGSLRYLNTEQTAYDMLSIVRAHGREKLQYWGFSYGTVLGAVFASLFPDKIERMIIDAVVDADEYFGNKWSNPLSDAPKVLDYFFNSCSQAGPTHCPFWAPSPASIRANLTALYTSLRSSPIPILPSPNTSIPAFSTYGIFDYSNLRAAIFQSFYAPFGTFPILAQGLADLAAGDPRLLFTRFNNRDPEPFDCSCEGSRTHFFDRVRDASVAIYCNDRSDVPEELEWTRDYFDKMVHASEFGDTWSTSAIACQGWPKFPKTNFRGPFKGNTSHPILFIGNTADPVTPLWGAHKMSQGFPTSVVLTQDSFGHGSPSAPFFCTAQHVRKYFQTGTLPPPGTICDVVGDPFPAEEKITAAVVVNNNNESDDGEGRSQAIMMTTMSEDKKLLEATIQLSKMPFIPYLPFALNSRTWKEL